MKRRLFTDGDTTPTENLLRKQLGAAMSYYESIIGTSGDYRKQWQFSRGNGWILKVCDPHKALYYLIAFDEGIEISLTVRDTERAEFLKNNELQDIFPQFEAATKYSEGYALRFEVESTAQCRAVMKFITELIKVRPPKAVVAHVARQPKGKNA